MTGRPKALIVVNVEWYFYSHRLELARALRDRGFEVVVAAAVERDRRAAIEAEGLRFIALPLERRSTSIFRELKTLMRLFTLYRAERPDVVHHVSIKPVLYGSVAARLAGIPAVLNTVPGLGYMFLGRGWAGRARERAATLAYRIALANPRGRVIFQNPDDRDLFVRRKIVRPERAHVIRGSGVNVSTFAPSPVPTGVPVVLLASRPLWDKGIGEVVAAARLLRTRAVPCRIAIVGVPDEQNPNAVPADVLRGWEHDGLIEWWGLRHDMAAVYRLASIATLPSYYPEGVPLSLLEAAAAGLPIVTTDTPGCREVVRDGRNGMLVPPRDAPALAAALERLLVDPAQRAAMGAVSREMAVAEFSVAHVNAETLALYDRLMGRATVSD